MIEIEILYFEGCPGHAAATDLVNRVVRESARQLEVAIKHIAVTDEADAQALRFLGSPTVRVNGRDVDPGADERTDFAMQCRVYAVDGKLRNTPPREWIERALGLA